MSDLDFPGPSLRQQPEIGNKRFLELNAEEARVHRAKAAGYSGSDNPDTWANFREAEAWGVAPSVGCAVRLGDKYRRAQNLMRNPANDQVGESLKDTLMDLSNYAKILICLLEEEEVAKRAAMNEPPPSWGKGYLCTDLEHFELYGEAEHSHGEGLYPRTFRKDPV